MKLKKVIIGVFLVMLISIGISGMTEAKTKVETITVKVDKADMATAKKVDSALKKGKQLTLKVKGSKKASKKLLVKLQKAVADYNKYGVMFDLSDTSLSSEGNRFNEDIFNSYDGLDYKQAGGYGKYTIWKYRCNAYKWALKMFEKNFEKSDYYKILENNTEEDYQEYCNEAWEKYKNECDEYSCDYLYHWLLDKIKNEYASYVPLETAQMISNDKSFYAEGFWEFMDVICSNVVSNKFNIDYGNNSVEDLEELWEDYSECHRLVSMVEKEAEGFNIDSINVKDAVSVPNIPQTYYDYLVKRVKKKSLADFWTGKRNSLDTSDIDIVRCLVDLDIQSNLNFAGDIYWNSTAYCFKKVYKGTAKGAHGSNSDFDKAYGAALQYLGIRAYRVYHIDKQGFEMNCCMFSSVSLGAKKRVLYMYLFGELYSATADEYYNPDPHREGFHSYLVCDSSKYAESHTLEKALRMKGDNAYLDSMGSDFPFKRKYVAWKKK